MSRETHGDTDGDGDYDALYTLGGRSFSIWSADGSQVFDSEADLERIIAADDPAHFNASNENNNFDDRSDNKGPEPEGLTVGNIRGRQYVFVGLERHGGIAAYDISTPSSPVFADYVNNRDFSVAIPSLPFLRRPRPVTWVRRVCCSFPNTTARRTSRCWWSAMKSAEP